MATSQSPPASGAETWIAHAVPEALVLDLMSDDDVAVEEYFRVSEVGQVEGNLDAAIEYTASATTRDPTFAVARFALCSSLVSANRSEEALPAIQATMDHLYRLPERIELYVKTEYYFLIQQIDQADRVTRRWVRGCEAQPGNGHPDGAAVGGVRGSARGPRSGRRELRGCEGGVQARAGCGADAGAEGPRGRPRTTTTSRRDGPGRSWRNCRASGTAPGVSPDSRSLLNDVNSALHYVTSSIHVTPTGPAWLSSAGRALRLRLAETPQGA